MNELKTSEEICEALVRHVEVSGYEVFSKHFEVPGKGITCTVWCMIGDNAQEFTDMIEEWLISKGFKDTPG